MVLPFAGANANSLESRLQPAGENRLKRLSGLGHRKKALKSVLPRTVGRHRPARPAGAVVCWLVAVLTTTPFFQGVAAAFGGSNALKESLLVVWSRVAY